MLDANVLFGRTLRDVLLYAAAEGLYQARWSTETLDEVRRNLVQQGKLTTTAATRLLALLQDAFDEAEVVDYERYLEQVENHPKDRHVSAAALQAGAAIIVTKNLSDFAPAPHGVVVESPDAFLNRLLNMSQTRVLKVIRILEATYGQPRLTVEDLLMTLNGDAPHFVTRVRTLLGM